MGIRIGSIIFASIATEILGIVVLVILVAALGPKEADKAQAFAENLGFWVGPLSGFVFCLAGGYFVAILAKEKFLVNGLGVGIGAAILDLAIVIAAGVPFMWIFVVSNSGRIIAGFLGGIIADRNKMR